MALPIFQDPRFDALRNAIYHAQRQRVYERRNQFVNFCIILLGTAVAAKITEMLKFQSVYFEFGIVLLATAQLIFDFGSSARRHEFLQKRYYELLSEMEHEEDIVENPVSHRKWSAKLLLIAGEEPQNMRALNAVAYNEALCATSNDPDFIHSNRQNISFIQYMFRNIFAFPNSNFQPST